MSEKPKHHVSDLAVFGGNPYFDAPLHVGRPYIPDREKVLKRINEAMDGRRLTNNGPLVQEFERRIADYIPVRNCIATCNGTVALELAIRALDLSGNVVIPSFTFIATAHALQWLGSRPLFCDIDRNSHTLDPAAAERRIDSETTGIIGVHTWGRTCDTKKLTRLAARHEIGLLFDASHAFGCSHGGILTGCFGAAEVFSFHATKFLQSFEGGAVVTNDDDLADRIRLMRDFGFSGTDHVVSIGTNGKMTEISAAMGLTSFEAMEDTIDSNEKNYLLYREGLETIRGIRLNTYPPKEKNNYQFVTALIEDVFPLPRDDLMNILHRENIKVRRYFYPGCHRSEPYVSMPEYAGLSLPETDYVSGRILVFPTGPETTTESIHKIIELLEFLSAHGRDVERRIESTELAQA